MSSSSDAFEAQTEWLPDDASLIAVVREQGSGVWASGVAVGLADIVGRRRGRTFLANVGGDARELDGVLDVAGGPGLTSALSGMTSIASIARSAPERSFTYLPGGESPLPLSDLSRMPSFRRLLRKMSAGGGTLLLYVAEEDLGGRVAEAATDLRLSGCIALGSVEDVALELGAPLLARVEQPVRPDDATATASPSEESDADAVMATGRNRPWMLRLAWTAAVLAVLWVLWLLGGSPGVDGSRASESADPSLEATGTQPAEEPPPTVAPPAWEAPAANYSVLVGSYVRLGDAEERRAALARSGGLFFVSPTPVRGRVYYRVFAGVFEDQSDALAAMERLVVDGHKEAVKLWDVRPVRLAHDLGTFDERAIADELVASLGEDGIPAYVLSESVDGSRFKVYAGAFESEIAAAPLSELLASRELASEFGPRSGLAP